MVRPASRLHFNRRQLVVVAVLVIGLYVIIPQFGDFRSSWHLLRQPSGLDVAFAIGCTALTYLAAAFIYYCLAFRPLAYWRLVLVQLAAMFVNRLLPAGLGALGVNYAYLHKSKHTAAQATTVVGVNNLLGFIGNMLLIAIVLAASGHRMVASSQLHLRTILIICLGLVVCLMLAILFAGRRFRRLAADVGRQLTSYRRRPLRLAGGLFGSMVLTLCNVLCLHYCTLALGVHLELAPVLLILTFGVGAGAATPTPGGLGGFEAGLVAGLVAYHIDASTALAIALLYRLISYWLALAVGAIAFVICQRWRVLG